MKSYEEFILNEAKRISKTEKEINDILDKKKLSKRDKENLYKYSKQNIGLCDNVVYLNLGSEHYEKSGVVLEIRDDGKYVVRFKDGNKLACSPAFLKKLKRTKAMKTIDPFDEEDWGITEES